MLQMCASAPLACQSPNHGKSERLAKLLSETNQAAADCRALCLMLGGNGLPAV